ncbi:MAG: copper resistance protein B [Proteobacteria bacterium]|nr:copper resistance protein B [Pseudomonadota bacterium]
MKKLFFGALTTVALAVVLPAYNAEAQEKSLTFYGVQMEEFEYRRGDEGENLFTYDGEAFVGTDEFKFRWLGKGEVDGDTSEVEEMENRFVGQIPISDFFDFKAGIRWDRPKGNDHVFGVIGLTGLAQQWFEVDADAFISESGGVSLRLDAEYEMLLTNRLILTPSAEIEVGVGDDEKHEIGGGLSTMEVGLRLSYDLVDRTISPYIGVVYERKFFNRKDMAKEEGEDVDALFFAVGTRFMF